MKFRRCTDILHPRFAPARKDGVFSGWPSSVVVLVSDEAWTWELSD